MQRDPMTPRGSLRRRVMWATVALFLLSSCKYVSCQSETPPRSEFDPDSIKLKAWCAPDDDGNFPEGIKKVDKGDKEEYSWAEGGGCVHRPIEDLWAILHDIPYLIGYDNGTIDEYDTDVLEPDEGDVTHTYEIDYTVDDVMTVEWTMLWTHTLAEGTWSEPEHVVVNYRRTEGSRFMPYWEGNMVLERVTDDVTAVFIHDEIDTMRSTPESAAEAVQKFYAKFEDGEPDYEAMKENARGPAAEGEGPTPPNAD